MCRGATAKPLFNGGLVLHQVLAAPGLVHLPCFRQIEATLRWGASVRSLGVRPLPCIAPWALVVAYA